MSTVTECAKALGEAIVASKEYKDMQVAENAAMSDPAVAEAMGHYLEIKGKIDEAMRGQDADPNTLSLYGRQMDEIQQSLNAMPAVDEMTSARQRFSELMNQVNHVLEFIITGEVAQEGGCSGNCGSCGGCH